MRILDKVAVCALLILLALAGPVHARTIYVNAAYTGMQQDGTSASPYRTIAAALSAAAPGTGWETGDVILVLPGRYYGFFRPKDFVTIQGTDPLKSVIVDPMVTAYPDAANVRFSKIGFYDDCHTAFTVNRVGYARGAWILEDCIFEEIRRGVDARGNVDVRMTRCVFFGYDYDYSLMMEYGTGTATVANCVFFQPRVNALRLTRTDTGRIDVVNSIFVGSPDVYYQPAAVYAWTYSYPTSIDLGRLVSIGYSDLFRIGLQASVNREALLQADPLFRSTAFSYYQKPDFRLRPSSPCIDTGIFAGLPYLGLAPDMGAYEFDGTPAPPPPPPPPPADPTLAQALDALETSYSELTEADLATPAEQRRNAFLNKFDAVNRQYDDIKSGTLNPQNLRKTYENLRDKLTGDLIPKCDAHAGGNEANDWIVDPAERKEIYDLLQKAVALLDEEIAALP